MSGLEGARLYADGYIGHTRIIIDKESRVVIGATFIGPQVGELLHSATVAIIGRCPLNTFGMSYRHFLLSARFGYACWKSMGFDGVSIMASKQAVSTCARICNCDRSIRLCEHLTLTFYSQYYYIKGFKELEKVQDSVC